MERRKSNRDKDEQQEQRGRLRSAAQYVADTALKATQEAAERRTIEQQANAANPDKA